MRVGHAVQHQQEWRFHALQQARQIVLLILTPFAHPGDDPLVHRAFNLVIQPLAVRHLDHDAGRFQLGDQRLQAAIFAAFQDKHFQEALRIAL